MVEHVPPAAIDRADLMRSVNDGVALFAEGSPDIGEEWLFACECGALDCECWVVLPLARYLAIRADDEGSVLAPEHTRAGRARADARALRDSSLALRAQSFLQQGRAARLRAPWQKPGERPQDAR